MKKAFTLVPAMLLAISMATTAFAASNVPAPVAGFGSYDDVYVFNTALTQDQVKEVMNAEFGSLNASAGFPVVPVVAVVALVVIAAAFVLLKKKKAPAEE